MYMFVFWFIGVITAWFQIKYWNRQYTFTYQDYIALSVISLLSWGIYVIMFVEWIKNHLNIK